MTILAFAIMSLAWSFSWFAMKLQIQSILPPELSLLYRFAITSVLMLSICFITNKRIILRGKEWRFFFFIGLTNFCLNFVIGYYAALFIPSGMVAVIFSLSIITSEILSSLVNKRKIKPKVLVSSLVGVIGLGFFVFPTINFAQHDDMIRNMTGVGLGLLMVLAYSIGNVLVEKNQKLHATPLYTSITYGCSFSAIFLLLINLAKGNHFMFDYSLTYILSLTYLILIASVLAFICMFYLIHKIGAAKANYTALVYPVIALTTSSFLENYHFTLFSIAGVTLILLALAIEFLAVKPKSVRALN